MPGGISLPHTSREHPELAPADLWSASTASMEGDQPSPSVPSPEEMPKVVHPLICLNRPGKLEVETGQREREREKEPSLGSTWKPAQNLCDGGQRPPGST